MTYDALAFSGKPLFYLSAPVLTERILSGSYPITTNNLSLSDQPLVMGHGTSFLVNADEDIVISGNPIFFTTGNSVEFIFSADKPTSEYGILVDPDNFNGIYADEDGLTLKLFFNMTEGSISKTARVEVKKWRIKQHVILSFTDTSAEIVINGVSQNISYEEDVTTITDCQIGYNLNGNQFRIDGFGIYSILPPDKSSYIDDPGSGHSAIASSLYSGKTGFFNIGPVAFDTTIKSSDFVAFNNYFTYNFNVFPTTEYYNFVMIIPDDDNARLTYNIDNGTDIDLNDFGYADIDEQALIVLTAQDISMEFSIRMVGVFRRDIFMDSPASLSLTGIAHYSMVQEESVVNNPNGVRLLDSFYDGQWIYGESIPDSPNTIEIVFKAHDISEKTYIFSSSDGKVSYGPSGSIVGYSCYLNGQLVTDLDDIQQDVWYHLALTITSPTADDFKLNNDISDPRSNEISYLFLTAYPTQLSQPIIQSLYQVVFGIDSVSAEESSATFQEGEFSSGKPYRIYSFAWAIVASGG